MRNCRPLFIAVFLLPVYCFAQTGQLKGVVLDAASKDPLAFVSILVQGSSIGATTDIDGMFTISQPGTGALLLVSHIGYTTRQVQAPDNNNTRLTIYIDRSGNQLENVTITAGENRAHRIIRLVQQNRWQNDPELYPSFKYNAYTVASFGAGNRFWQMNSIDSTQRKKMSSSGRIQDTATEKLADTLGRRFKENYFMVSESYTERLFKYPKQTKETVLATKISGFKSPAFAFTTSNFQPFGFYKDYIQMLNKPYVSPLINGSIGMYKFRLTAIQPHGSDTTFIISFEPGKNRNFTGLKGLLYINSAKFAIENAVASPADEKGLIMRFRLQQKYEPVNGNWFPAQLNTTILQTDLVSDSVLLYWDTRSYITNVTIGQPYGNADFSDLSLDYLPQAGKRTEKEWSDFRKDSLKEKEKNTYETFRMMPPNMLNTLDKFNGILEALALEAIPAGKVDIPFKYFITGINKYEKFRLGGGFQTNPLFSKWLSLGGYAGYGFGDKAWKYGANLQWTIQERTVSKLRFLYSQDLSEPGNTAWFTQNSSLFSNQSLRSFYTSRMDSVQQYRLDFTTKLRPFLQTDYWLLNELRSPAAYRYEFKTDNSNNLYRQYRNTEFGVGLRFTRGESFTKVGRAKIIARPAGTEFLLQLSKGISGFSKGDLTYTKLALQLQHNFNLKRLGQTSFQLEAGQIWGQVPYAYLFNSRASRTSGTLTLFIPNTFQTVQLYEFASSRSASLFFQHNFGSLLWKPRSIYFRPELVLVQNIGYGNLEHANNHVNIDFTAPVKGLYESGLLIKNLYRRHTQLFYFGIGGGVFYRYGYYSLPKKQDNWVGKFGITVSF